MGIIGRYRAWRKRQLLAHLDMEERRMLADAHVQRDLYLSIVDSETADLFAEMSPEDAAECRKQRDIFASMFERNVRIAVRVARAKIHDQYA